MRQPSLSFPNSQVKKPRPRRHDLGEPVAERLLLRQHALKAELLLDARAHQSRDRVIRDLGGAAAVADDERAEDELLQLRRGVGVLQPEHAQEAVHGNPERIGQPRDRRAVAVLVPRPAGQALRDRDLHLVRVGSGRLDARLVRAPHLHERGAGSHLRSPRRIPRLVLTEREEVE